MSEMRQRRGERPAEAEDTVEEKSGGWSPEQKAQVEEKLASLMKSMKANPKPGTSNEAKKYKDLLDEDPFNLLAIYGLGKAYAVDEQWDRCCNVMLRGFKRVNEMENQEERFDFLVTLAKASMNLEKFRQALAVVNDMSDPEDPEELRGLNIMRCQVYCHNGELQKGLKAFNTAIEGNSFQDAVKAWASCSRGLKQVNGWGVTKNTVLKLAETEEEKKQLESIDKLCEFKDDVHKLQAPKGISDVRLWLLTGLLVVLLCILLSILYWFEQRSLAKMEWRK
mmetsp:Transcript_96857/g.134461  ORF Transcript_96857/g.134461 Transcript_96857/m.134461 type:complete len:280 (-) Transcript_96857:169-1008(-)